MLYSTAFYPAWAGMETEPETLDSIPIKLTFLIPVAGCTHFIYNSISSRRL
jgi:hypothetical protein